MSAGTAAASCRGHAIHRHAAHRPSPRLNVASRCHRFGLTSSRRNAAGVSQPRTAGARSLRRSINATATTTDPRVEVEKPRGGFNRRQLFASVEINAPAQTVWDALTSYDSLQNFIPGLKENKVLERRKNGALLLQVGEEDLALGVKFEAKVTLEIEEHPRGVPASRLWSPDGTGDGKLPEPRDPWSSEGISNHRDISFELVAGDFKGFDGIWRISPGAMGPSSCRLAYSVMVKPGPLLPVRLVEPRVRGEIVNNLKAVRAYAESQAARDKEASKCDTEGLETADAV